MQPVIYWFRRDLRLRDNAALAAAAESGHPLLPVYVLDDQDLGGASRWWLHHSLASLDIALRERGSKLVLRRGDPARVLRELVAECGAAGLYFTRRYEPESRRQEAALDDLPALTAYDDALLLAPNALTTGSGTPYRVFTPFWKAAQRLGPPPAPGGLPPWSCFAEPDVPSDDLDSLGLLPTAPDWAGGLRDSWQPGEDGALNRLDSLEHRVADYASGRDRPDLDATSRLSPHVHFGEIGVRQVWHALRCFEANLRGSQGPEALLRQLYWRDFSSYQLYHFPRLPEEPLRGAFEHFPWCDDDTALDAWQRGRTGYPLVDAGMRQLWHSGWMHNRVRMVVASFLVKDLLVPWQRGAEWFLDTLVDADLGNNSASWQWVAGCGTDAAPYFRIFNPVQQGRRFDPDGDYVHRWVPELRALSADVVHEPWRAAGDAAGGDYPAPIVDHADARRRALAAYDEIKGMRTSNDAP